MPETGPILFTLEHAQRVLARIRPAVAEMVRASRELQVLAPSVRRVSDRLARNGGSRPSAAMVSLMGSLQRALVTIQSEGVLVKDVARGLLDFPALRDGRVVLLCWMHGEVEIGFWHEEYAGLPGRQPLDGI
ncbi:MAG: DUF2203 domain-containing protein [Anaerolineales bacterium]|nr:DUF2203 domain-containing protein [Anaerolineales bacterium]